MLSRCAARYKRSDIKILSLPCFIHHEIENIHKFRQKMWHVYFGKIVPNLGKNKRCIQKIRKTPVMLLSYNSTNYDMYPLPNVFLKLSTLICFVKLKIWFHIASSTHLKYENSLKNIISVFDNSNFVMFYIFED